MKMLVHRTAVSGALPFVLDDIKLHLRVPDDAEDTAIQNIGVTAAAEIEHFAQIALLAQEIRWTIFNPTEMLGLTLPIGPVLDGDAPTVLIDGNPFTGFDFEPGLRPYLHWRDAFHNLAPTRIVVTYTAGFGTSASDVPSDLAQAVMDQAGLHYDLRSPVHKQKWLTNSPHMARVGARYRGVQV